MPTNIVQHFKGQLTLPFLMFQFPKCQLKIVQRFKGQLTLPSLMIQFFMGWTTLPLPLPHNIIHALPRNILLTQLT